MDFGFALFLNIFKSMNIPNSSLKHSYMSLEN